MKKKPVKEFSAEMLPHSRKALFSDCLHQRFDLICKCALVLLISFLPMLVVLLVSNLAYSSMHDSNVDASVLLAFHQIVSAAKIPCYSLAGLGFAAISRILRQLAWGEPILFTYHLRLGIKQNSKRFVLIFTIAGVIGFLCSFSGFLGSSFLAYLPGLLSVVFLLPIGLFMLSQAVFYDVTFGTSFTNSFGLYFISFLPTLAFSLLICLVGAIDFVPFVLIRVLLYLLSVLGLSVLTLGWLIFSCHIFDKTINHKHFPDLVGKGLYHPSFFEDDSL